MELLSWERNSYSSEGNHPKVMGGYNLDLIKEDNELVGTLQANGWMFGLFCDVTIEGDGTSITVIFDKYPEPDGGYTSIRAFEQGEVLFKITKLEDAFCTQWIELKPSFSNYSNKGMVDFYPHSRHQEENSAEENEKSWVSALENFDWVGIHFEEILATGKNDVINCKLSVNTCYDC